MAKVWPAYPPHESPICNTFDCAATSATATMSMSARFIILCCGGIVFLVYALRGEGAPVNVSKQVAKPSFALGGRASNLEGRNKQGGRRTP